MVLLTWGHTTPRTAKTAAGLLRFCAEECIALLDPDEAGRQADELLGVGEGVPVIGSLAEAPQAKTLVIGIAPPGGKIPVAWRQLLMEAVDRGLNIVSGLHDYLVDDEALAKAAAAKGVTLHDVRRNCFREVARYPELNPECFRIHTVGHDCSVGKMLASVSLSQGLQERGRDTQLIATGQTGIMISGDGLPVDSVVADFVSGAVESLVVKHQHRQVLVVEGQGSLVHPSYSAVTLGLLHGCRPHALVMVFEAGRTHVGGLEHVVLPSVAAQIQLFETMASVHEDCKVIAIAINGSRKTPDEAHEIAQKMEQQLQLPVVDIVRDGPDRLLDTAEAYYLSKAWQRIG